ncbi:acetylornithine transaminase [Ureibacillus chungkukjangi]|uniref:Acetylornithine aminotransferase n=1 Tax=Ureibacillus chungkukjangi TaxID=1202712 RepID=A0A318TXQ3_9BACL|nr:acetylornithine transaminase [Ureibacillus chungkukjangi]MCM3387447.1 acetylornithine transaminase [Ureibacillus chungkukjangi]PYF09073.1 acetylornithine aminotransferase [Ureibacillus chungkukjangi]
MNALFNNYSRRPICIVEGKGTIVKDSNGKQYLDFTSGIAVCCLGHAHPALVKTVQEQSEKLWHISNLFESPGQVALAESLVKDNHLAHALFCNSGAEANEAAIKLARKHTGKHHIITFKNSFHGRTFGAMSATGQEKIHKGFGPLVDQFTYLPFNDVEALKEAVDETVGAIMLEIIQGEGGIHEVTEEFAQAINEICVNHDILLIVDEVQTGIGRTGTQFAFEQTQLKPDIVSMAKGLGGGFPIGGILATAELYETFGPGSHGTTYGGNPLAVSVAQTVLDHVFNESFLNEVQDKSKYLINKLQEVLPQEQFEIRGKGLLLGIDCGKDVAALVEKAEKEGLLLVAAGPQVLRLLPPLTVTNQEIDEAVEILKKLLVEEKSPVV